MDPHARPRGLLDLISEEQLRNGQMSEQERLLALHGQTPVADHYSGTAETLRDQHKTAQQLQRMGMAAGALGAGGVGIGLPLIAAPEPITSTIGAGMAGLGAVGLGAGQVAQSVGNILDHPYQTAAGVADNFSTNGPAAHLPMNYAGRGSQHLLRGLLDQ